MNKKSNIKIMARMIKLVRPLKIYIVLAVCAGVAGHIAAAFITVLGALGITSALGFETALSVKNIFIIMGVFAVLRGILRYGEQACNHYIAFRLLAIIRDKVFRALRRLSPAKLEGKDRGNLISVITSDIELLEVFYAHTISPIAIAVLFSSIVCGIMLFYSPVLALTALAAFVFVGIVLPLITSGSSRDTGRQFRDGAGEISTFMLDSIRGVQEIMQYGYGEKRLEQLQSKSIGQAVIEKRMKQISGRNIAMTNFFVMFFDLAVLVVGSFLYQRGDIGFDGLLISFVLISSSFGPVIALSNLGSTLQSTFAAAGRVFDILDESPAVEENTTGKNVSFDGVTADNISFSYDKENILNNVNVNIDKGQIVGIVGKSGSGKSTFLKLLMRFWDADSGKIYFSGTDIKEIKTGSLRANESFMTQQTFLFNDTIKNNLKLAKPDATDKEIIAACKKASVHDFIISLKDGYDSKTGELGSSLSGGERQRLGLAMAFLHKGNLLLLDEPTSNLDSLNEAVILKALKEEKEERTVVLVTHRRSTAKIADKVFKVAQGAIC